MLWDIEVVQVKFLACCVPGKNMSFGASSALPKGKNGKAEKIMHDQLGVKQYFSYTLDDYLSSVLELLSTPLLQLSSSLQTQI